MSNFEKINFLELNPGVQYIAEKKSRKIREKRSKLVNVLFGSTVYVKGKSWIYKISYPPVKYVDGQGGGNWISKGFPKAYRKIRKEVK